MKNLELQLAKQVHQAIQDLYGYEFSMVHINFQTTRKEFEGDVTLIVFPILKISKMSPEQTATAIGNNLVENIDIVKSFNVIKGFLNLLIDDEYWLAKYANVFIQENYGHFEADKNDEIVVVEYCSPNTNKPLHLGHVRNNLLGYSVAQIIKASGRQVRKVQIVNDRGIHICKSMLAWKLYGDGETPESSGTKGDHLVGKYYVRFDKEYKKEVALLISKGKSHEVAIKEAPILLEAQNMLRKWESMDVEVRNLWKMMNEWVYVGFEKTFERMGINFDVNYFESDTYLLGKEYVAKGVQNDLFYQKKDGSIWVDLTDQNLDHKLLLRADGTTVYMTQDIGTAIQRQLDFDFSKMIYTVGNEQDYHFDVLFKILKKLGYSWADNCHHLSYGMVDLPSGKMKSREGTVVDADDLMQVMVNTARSISEKLGKLDDFDAKELSDLYETIGLGALKYFILKVDPKKRMLFDPSESIDFNGNTGPFIQYTHARICSLSRKSDKLDPLPRPLSILHPKEKYLVKMLLRYPEVIQEAARHFSPAMIANFTFDLVKEYNQFYQLVPIYGAENPQDQAFRLGLSAFVGRVISSSMNLLGISVPDRM